MKKYDPVKMIRKSRFSTFYDKWNAANKEKLITKIKQLIEANSDYADSANYEHLCNLLTALAMVMVLESCGKTRAEAEKLVADAMYSFIQPQVQSMQKLASYGYRFLRTRMCCIWQGRQCA